MDPFWQGKLFQQINPVLSIHPSIISGNLQSIDLHQSFVPKGTDNDASRFKCLWSASWRTTHGHLQVYLVLRCLRYGTANQKNT